MAHYANTDLGVSFDLPDDPTVADILRYDSTRIEQGDGPAILVLWECVKPVIVNWECEALTDYHLPLDKVKSYKAAQAVEWAAFRGSEWRIGLDAVSKNL